MRILTVIMLAMSLSLPWSGAALAQAAPTISIAGEGRVASAPDMATISLGVTTVATTAAEAMAMNAAELVRVIANLTAAGIEARDVQTTGLMLNPNWVYDTVGAAGRISGYTAVNMINVRVRVLDGLGGVLDAAVRDGANTLHGLSFGLADPRPLQDQARVLAVQDAQARAALLAQAAGLQLGAVQTMSEISGYGDPTPMFRAEAAADQAGVPVQGGEIIVTASVLMTWEIAR